MTETNRYAAQAMTATHLSAHSRMSSWTDTDSTEMMKFVVLLLWMGLVKLPSISGYSSMDKLYLNQVARKIMTRNRFQLLRRMWHFSDNSMTLNEEDRLHKIRGLHELILEKFCAYRQPGEDIVIYENIVPFRGRLKFRQYAG